MQNRYHESRPTAKPRMRYRRTPMKLSKRNLVFSTPLVRPFFHCRNARAFLAMRKRSRRAQLLISTTPSFVSPPAARPRRLRDDSLSLSFSLFYPLSTLRIKMAANNAAGRQGGGNQSMNEHVEFSVSATSEGKQGVLPVAIVRAASLII